MKKIIKKSCKGCRALEAVDNVNSTCTLGYAMNGYEPEEPCPKPRTISAYIKEYRNVTRKDN